jgi:predicted DsbA family dithiol-disulfide isomerase
MSLFKGGVELIWRAFELDPGAPIAGPGDVDYVGKLAAKYRTSREGAQSMIDRMVSVGRESGLDFRFDRIRPTNTFDAHRLLSWSADFGLQDPLMERLFAAYMNEGRVVSDHKILAELASEVGLDADQCVATLSTDSHAQEVRDEQRQASRMGVSGVPFFRIGRYALAGAQPAETLLEAMEAAMAETEISVASDTAESAACGADGCELPPKS